MVFNPVFSTLYFANVKLELVKDTNPAELRGSILYLQEATEQDSGVYVCDITSFPDGSIKNVIKVQVTGKFIIYLIGGGTVGKIHSIITVYTVMIL